MNAVIENQYLRAEISPHGAQMQSIQGSDGTEYLWQGDASVWPDRALNLFPYIGRLTDGKYRFGQKEYRMKIHGIVPYATLTVSEQTAKRVRFVLESNEETAREYPFSFRYSIEYILEHQTIRVVLGVENKDEKTMYFGIGGHPGFQVPIGGAGSFEDCYLEFEKPAEACRVGFSDTCFVNGQEERFPLQDGVRLPLRHALFDEDAIVLRGMCRRVSLRSAKTKKSVTVDYPQMEYLGIWHMPKTEAAYVCIEPWSSLPSRDGVIESLETQPGLIRLEAGKTYRNEWNITIGQ